MGERGGEEVHHHAMDYQVGRQRGGSTAAFHLLDATSSLAISLAAHVTRIERRIFGAVCHVDHAVGL